MMPAYHNPKKYPKSPEQLLRDPNAPVTPEDMLRVLEGLVGNYGDKKPEGVIREGSIHG